MGLWANLIGTAEAYFRLGKTGPRLKNSGGDLHVRNAGDTAYAPLRADSLVADEVSTTVSLTVGIGGAGATFEPTGLTGDRTLQLPNASATLVGLAGQLGGSGESPDVRGLRETGGPTLLTMGAVADGSLLSRSGSTIVGATAGQWKRLATATASSSATIEFTGLSSSYAAYMVVFSHVAPATDNVSLLLRTSTNNGSSYDSGASDYSWGCLVWSELAASALTGDTADSEIQLGGGTTCGNAANEDASGSVLIYNPAAAKYGSIISDYVGNNYAGTLYRASCVGKRLSAASVNGIRFLFSSGNIASGQFDLYGLST